MSEAEARPVLVLSGHTMALGVVRALGEAGIPVFVLHYDARDMAHVSRHVKAELTVPSPQTHEDELVGALLNLAPRFEGAMLLPASDEATLALSRHKAALSEHYLVACTDWEVTRNFIEKRRTYELAAKAGVATPETLVPSSVSEAHLFARRIGFPLLVKPSQSHVYFDRFKRKMRLVEGETELAERVGEALRAGIEVMLQEIVPGPDTEVVNYNAYAWGGRSLVEFTARQLRKAPPRLGSPRVAVSERIPEVIEPGRATLRALGFQGFACSEFKRDPRDGRYKIVDVNGRHNLSGLLAVRCGINFPLIHYRHLVCGELPEPIDFTPGVYWIDTFRDVGYSARYLLEEHLAPWSYLAPYLGKHCDAIIDLEDLRPAWERARYLAAFPLRALGAWGSRP
jgi:predicted ATP-grasp superfamily ATP-dependent carboligase